MTTALAWIPFLEPINAFQTWWYLLLVPLAFGISVIYKALRLQDLTAFWREATIMTVQVVGGIVALAICVMVFVQFVIPALPQ